jgi:hypothetical protein
MGEEGTVAASSARERPRNAACCCVKRGQLGSSNKVYALLLNLGRSLLRAVVVTESTFFVHILSCLLQQVSLFLPHIVEEILHQSLVNAIELPPSLLRSVCSSHVHLPPM